MANGTIRPNGRTVFILVGDPDAGRRVVVDINFSLETTGSGTWLRLCPYRIFPSPVILELAIRTTAKIRSLGDALRRRSDNSGDDVTVAV